MVDRRPESVVIAFFVYAAATAIVLPVAPAIRLLTVLLNSFVILGYGVLALGDRGRRSLAIGIARDWLRLGLILLAYREMGWFALPHRDHALEARWIVWDRAILHGGIKAAIETFGPVLPSVLEIAYALVYALAPFSLAVLYLYRRRDRVERFLFIFSLGVLLCYAQFPLWPSEPPRVVFAGQDVPAFDTIFRRFNWWMLGNCGIHTSVFPSAHVAAAFSAAFGMRQALPERKWVSRFLAIMALLIAVATVYGRYHYVADALAGFSVAVFAFAIDAALQGVRRRLAVRRGASSSASAGLPVARVAGVVRLQETNRAIPVTSLHPALGAGNALSYSAAGGQPNDED